MKFIFGTLLLLSLVACDSKQTSEGNVFFPHDFPMPVIPADNPMNEDIVFLGKQLFFDRNLSSNKQVNCATCHMPGKSFADFQALGTRGVTGKPLVRHSPALINLAYINKGLFWDGGAKNLESLVFAPLTHPDEMGGNLEEVEVYLRQHMSYAKTIKKLFKVEEVKVQFAAKAIAQYVRSLVSYQSKYDSVRRGESDFSATEFKGYQLFQKNCSACHQEPLLTDNQFHNNGLDASFEDVSEELMFTGRYRITHDSLDVGKYKTPTLRNVALTAPYMHDGRFTTLDDVLTHYTQNVQKSATLDTVLYTEDKLGIKLSSTEKVQIKAFLETLTDSYFINKN